MFDVIGSAFQSQLYAYRASFESPMSAFNILMFTSMFTLVFAVFDQSLILLAIISFLIFSILSGLMNRIFIPVLANVVVLAGLTIYIAS